jgi:hypothetical protein
MRGIIRDIRVHRIPPEGGDDNRGRPEEASKYREGVEDEAGE